MAEHPFVVAMHEGDLEAATEAIGRETPLHVLMGLRIAAHDVGHTVITMELNEAVRGSNEQPLHGGMLATLSDVASAWALLGTYRSSDGRPVTTDLHIRYSGSPAPARSPPLRPSSTTEGGCSASSAP